MPECLLHLWKNKLISSSDVLLVTAVGFPATGNRMNLIQTHHVKDLKTPLSGKVKNINAKHT